MVMKKIMKVFSLKTVHWTVFKISNVQSAVGSPLLQGFPLFPAAREIHPQRRAFARNSVLLRKTTRALFGRRGLLPLNPASASRAGPAIVTAVRRIFSYESFSNAFLIREILSFLPRTAASSIPPPGVRAFPESATRTGQSIQPFFTPCFSISANMAA